MELPDVMDTLSLPTVLIVDDDRTSRTVLADLLHGECRVLLAKDGPSALQRVREEPEICLLLLDIAMPGMDGYEVLQALHANPRTTHVAVIFISGLNDARSEEQGLLLGAVDYVVKPIRPAIARIRIRNHLRLIAQRKELERLASRDGLTGIANRRSFDESLQVVCQLAARRKEAIGISMIDVDFFKQYNDLYGHPAGDDALRRIAQVVASFARRPYDLAARYGGEEFVLLLPAVPDMDQLLERLRTDVMALGLPHAGSDVASVVTISIGAVNIRAGGRHDPALLLEQADAMLYQAKHQGRNRVVSGAFASTSRF
nr:diguanylate cyclase [uncultured Albidiferax sp.]